MSKQPTIAGDSLLRAPEVCSRLGIGRSSLYSLVQRGELCPPIKVSLRISAWRSSAIDAFIDRRERVGGLEHGR